ncbi:MAG: N-acetyltransferase [Phycisphaerae bacterium]|nr:N-acetyltransferase [Phycisphaerae bacterium]
MIERKGQEPGPTVVRRAGGCDMDSLLTIEQQCFNVYYYDYYTLDRRDFEFYLQDTDSFFLVAARGSQVVGYILGPVDPWRDPPRAHIDSIGVLPEDQNKGVGSRLLTSFAGEARQQGCTRVTLEVATANEVGLTFFAKHGFRKTRRRPDYYGNGLPGLFMVLELR